MSLTYSELLFELGHGFTRPRMRTICRTLAAVDDDAAAFGEPELAVLVVRQADGLPGQGWWSGPRMFAVQFGGPWSEGRASSHVADLQRKAWDYWGRKRTCGQARRQQDRRPRIPL